MLTPRATRLRELGLFAAAALLPAVAIAALGLRAISNEEAGARREAAVALDAAADRVTGSVERAVTLAARELGRAPAAADLEGEARALKQLSPAFADAVVLDASRSLLLPRAEAPRVRPPEACTVAAEQLATSSEESVRRAARAVVLEQCAEAQRDRRWIWPVVAVDACRRGLAEGPVLVDWLEAHAGALSPAERDATRADIASSELPAELRSRALAALAAEVSRRDAVDAALREPEVVAALRAPPDAAGVVTWVAGRSTGALRKLDDGRAVGFVVHARALTDALASHAIELPPEFRAAVVEGDNATRRVSRARGERLESRAEIAPLLGIRIEPDNPRSIAHHAMQRRALISAIAITTTLAAVAVAALLFSRMRAARRSSELRTDFVSAVSHELRTPIASVRMLAELLEEDRVEPEERAEVYEALAREARRLGETVDRLLGFSRMEAGRYVLERREVRVADAIEASVATFEERHPELKVERHFDRDAVALADEGQLRLAVDNLLANAAKYAPEGAPYQVQIASDRGRVTLAVQDHGPGVAPRDRERIFHPFERADDRLSRATEGSGIGLSLVLHVARAHGGTARVEPTPGGGARFTISIPRSSA